jgi:ribose transport system ATP-binding protein
MSSEPVDAKRDDAALAARGVHKSFAETRVLSGVDLVLKAGSVHGVVGANGAGKTTLMRILMGETRADEGTFTVRGASIGAQHWSGVRAAGGRIAMVHQEVPVFDNLRVYEHFALEGLAPGAGALSWRAAARRGAREALASLFPASGVSPNSAVAGLSLGRRQMLDIALAMSRPGLEVLVLDEPTSALDRQQAQQLKSAVSQLRNQGVAVLLVTHRLEELLSICDEITVLRDGRVAKWGPASEFDESSLIVAMGGAATANAALSTAESPGNQGQLVASPSAASKERLGATHGDALVARVPPAGGVGLAVEVRRGEIVGLAGLSGGGQSQLVTSVAQKRSRGATVAGRAAFVTGDRRGSGIFPLWSTLRNVSVGSLGTLGPPGWVFPGREKSTYKSWENRLRIRTSSPLQLVTTLSGGNQQKVLIARALAAQPRLLVLDDPTRGVDAGTKQEVYQLLRSSAATGMAVLWYSTEDEEMLRCDRVYVMRDGAVVREIRGPDLTREAIVTASFAPAGAGEEPDWDRPGAARPLRETSSLRGWWLVAAVLLGLVVATGIARLSALSLSGLPVLVSSFTPLVLAAAAELMVISVSDIDLGVGAFMGLINAVSATWLVSHPFLGALALVGFLVAYTCQGFIIGVRRVPAIIVTLGFSFVWLGLGLIVLPVPGGTAPAWLTSVGSANVPVVPEPLIVSIVVGVLTTLYFFRTRLGVRTRAVGNHPDGYAVRTGSPFAPIRERVVAWALAGILATLAGLSVTALTSSADPSASQPDTLLGIAAVIIGGADFVGGRVEPAGAVLGALMFGLLEAYLGLTSLNVNYTSLAEGAVLIGVLGLRLFFRPRVARRRASGALWRFRSQERFNLPAPGTAGRAPTEVP